jgi:hypothetical protein
MRLLYIAITKGWPAALFYDQQGGDEFLNVPPDFWAAFQPPPRPRAAQRRAPQARGRSTSAGPRYISSARTAHKTPLSTASIVARFSVAAIT